jgi:hypothetical protein
MASIGGEYSSTDGGCMQRRREGEREKVILTAIPNVDWIFLIVVLAIAGGIVYAVKSSAINENLEKQKEALKVRRTCPCLSLQN